MNSSPAKLEVIKPCDRVDKRIMSFISKNQQVSPFPNFPNQYFTLKKRGKEKSKPVYKTSLADWRSLYSDTDRPKSQSLINKWAINKHRTAELIKGEIKTVNKHSKVKSNLETKYQTGFMYSPSSRNENSWKSRKIVKGILAEGQNPEFSKTTMNFYSSPLKKEVELAGNLTARISTGKNNFRTHVKQSKAFFNPFD